ncbi:MAG: N-acetylmuramoyl-L-alanine amidase [Bradyrhizobium sp.]|nr:N-acetylmuramoyl-L-alanine amidase [Bradyrhizobium sp.]
MRDFQTSRGLRLDGVVGHQTWSALVEAGYRLGDRLLYLCGPALRGDDVAALQRQLGALGFDAGRVDGIFGPDTARALLDFQRNGGLTTDGICGPLTLQAFGRLGGKFHQFGTVGQVRELEALRNAPRTLAGRRLVLGHSGGLAGLADSVARLLTRDGAVVITLHEPEAMDQAAKANLAGAELYVGLELDPAADGCRTAYWAGFGGESAGGHRLAELIQAIVPGVIDVKDEGAHGMRLAILRETAMPAVVCELGPPAVVLERAARLAEALSQALTAWVADPCREA